MVTRARRGRGTLYKLLVAHGNQHGFVSARPRVVRLS
jgi:hypothetical protein